MIKEFFIDFALKMAVRRQLQSDEKMAASVWWSDLSEAMEDGISLREVQARHPANGSPIA